MPGGTSDVRVAALQLGVDYFGLVADHRQHAKIAGLADFDHHVTAMRESKQGKFEAEQAAQALCITGFFPEAETAA